MIRRSRRNNTIESRSRSLAGKGEKEEVKEEEKEGEE